MIIDSTPSSITCQLEDGMQVKFHGEWTLEPKFYLDKSNIVCAKSCQPLAPNEIHKAIDDLLKDSREKGWIIVEAPSNS